MKGFLIIIGICNLISWIIIGIQFFTVDKRFRKEKLITNFIIYSLISFSISFIGIIIIYLIETYFIVK